MQIILQVRPVRLKKKSNSKKKMPKLKKKTSKSLPLEVPDKTGKSYLQFENFSVWPNISPKPPLPNFWSQIAMWWAKKLPTELLVNSVLAKIMIQANKLPSNQNQSMQEYRCFFQSIDFIRYDYFFTTIRFCPKTQSAQLL